MHHRNVSVAVSFGATCLSAVALASPAVGDVTLAKAAPPTGTSRGCGAAPGENSCAPAPKMRALTPAEIQLIAGANLTTESHGSCGPGGCSVTATVGPPSGGGGGGGGGDGNGGSGGDGGSGGGGGGSTPTPVYPSSQQQARLTHCAQVYGGASAAPGGITDFSPLYAFASLDSSGREVGFQTAGTYDAPGTPPAGGNAWISLNGRTLVSTPPHSTLYMRAFDSDAQTVDTLTHEWYHQRNNTASMTAEQAAAAEAGATAAGQAAEQAYLSDNGAQCAE
ncbi:hypothetical protein ACVKN3_001679 [Luteibacter sp. PvP120]